MPLDYARVPLYHITEISNLPGIVDAGGLYSDVGVTGRPHAVIGYGHLKEKRLTSIRLPCCNNRLVGEFVPFYYCPRSPMLFAINRGQTGKPVGHQQEILHLMTSVGAAVRLGREWAISDGNASAAGVTFSNQLGALDSLHWNAIRARQWSGLTRQKAAEFLLADFYPWTAISHIGCLNEKARAKTAALLRGVPHAPTISIEPSWYYT